MLGHCRCAHVADSFLARAPSSLTVAGLLCLVDANGVYRVADTIGGKPHWGKTLPLPCVFHCLRG